MCGRYALYAERELLKATFGLAEAPDFPPSWNIAPSASIPAVSAADGAGRVAALYRWGLVPFWAKEIGRYGTINARAETIARKPAFREAFRKRRCLIPASGYYEWRKVGRRKQPYFIQAADEPLLAFAGLRERWRRPEGGTLDSAAIVVTGANAETRAIHGRMPVILAREDWNAWLAPDNHDTQALAALLEPAPPGLLRTHPVSTRVNSPRNDAPELVEAVPEGS